MKIKWKGLILSIAIPLIVGGLAGLISRGGMMTFDKLNKPYLSPPGWLFPIIWTILYILMGLASYIIITSGSNGNKTKTALKTYGIQLLFNFFWPIFFFNLNLYFFSFLWLVILWILILITTILFYKISKLAAYLILPYLLWVTFASYLNISIALLN